MPQAGPEQARRIWPNVGHQALILKHTMSMETIRSFILPSAALACYLLQAL